MAIKQRIGDIEYDFEFNNRSFIRLDEEFEDAGKIFNGVLTGEHHVSNSIKLLSVSCTDLNEEKILDNATAEQFCHLPDLANKLVLDYFGTKKSSKDTNKNGENTEDIKKK